VAGVAVGVVPVEVDEDRRVRGVSADGSIEKAVAVRDRGPVAGDAVHNIPGLVGDEKIAGHGIERERARRWQPYRYRVVAFEEVRGGAACTPARDGRDEPGCRVDPPDAMKAGLGKEDVAAGIDGEAVARRKDGALRGGDAIGDGSARRSGNQQASGRTVDAPDPSR